MDFRVSDTSFPLYTELTDHLALASRAYAAFQLYHTTKAKHSLLNDITHSLYPPVEPRIGMTSSDPSVESEKVGEHGVDCQSISAPIVSSDRQLEPTNPVAQLEHEVGLVHVDEFCGEMEGSSPVRDQVLRRLTDDLADELESRHSKTKEGFNAYRAYVLYTRFFQSSEDVERILRMPYPGEIVLDLIKKARLQADEKILSRLEAERLSNPKVQAENWLNTHVPRTPALRRLGKLNVLVYAMWHSQDLEPKEIERILRMTKGSEFHIFVTIRNVLRGKANLPYRKDRWRVLLAEHSRSEYRDILQADKAIQNELAPSAPHGLWGDANDHLSHEMVTPPVGEIQSSMDVRGEEAKSKRSSRRERRVIWRSDAHTRAAFRSTEIQPIVDLVAERAISGETVVNRFPIQRLRGDKMSKSIPESSHLPRQGLKLGIGNRKVTLNRAGNVPSMLRSEGVWAKKISRRGRRTKRMVRRRETSGPETNISLTSRTAKISTEDNGVPDAAVANRKRPIHGPLEKEFSVRKPVVRETAVSKKPLRVKKSPVKTAVAKEETGLARTQRTNQPLEAETSPVNMSLPLQSYLRKFNTADSRSIARSDLSSTTDLLSQGEVTASGPKRSGMPLPIKESKIVVQAKKPTQAKDSIPIEISPPARDLIHIKRSARDEFPTQVKQPAEIEESITRIKVPERFRRPVRAKTAAVSKTPASTEEAAEPVERPLQNKTHVHVNGLASLRKLTPTGEPTLAVIKPSQWTLPHPELGTKHMALEPDDRLATSQRAKHTVVSTGFPVPPEQKYQGSEILDLWASLDEKGAEPKDRK